MQQIHPTSWKIWHKSPLRLLKTALLSLSIALVLTHCAQQTSVKDAFPPRAPAALGGAGLGATVGGGLAGVIGKSSAAQGALTGALLGAALGSYYDSQGLLEELHKQGITVYELGDILEIVIPADYLFEGADTEIKITSYHLLAQIARLIQEYHAPKITITGHTDNVGSDFAKIELSTQQAQAVMTFLWTNGINLQSMNFYGMADTQNAGNFRTSIGAAYNRRIAITLWRSSPPSPLNGFQMGIGEDCWAKNNPEGCL